jgi:hypothetical protein
MKVNEPASRQIYTMTTLIWSIFWVILISILVGGASRGMGILLRELGLALVGIVGLPRTVIGLMIFGGFGAMIGNKRCNSLKGATIGVWLLLVFGIAVVLFACNTWN